MGERKIRKEIEKEENNPQMRCCHVNTGAGESYSDGRHDARQRRKTAGRQRRGTHGGELIKEELPTENGRAHNKYPHDF